ncbi:MAG: hypothetical protein ABR591_08965 [Candidatus Velthaea sp.]
MRPLCSAAVLALAAAFSAPAVAQTAKGCAGDILPVGGVAVCATFTAGAPAGRSVVVHESFTGAGKSTAKDLTIEIVPGAKASRTLDDVDLSPIVTGRSLHMTLRYDGGTVTLEHALLLPGAVPLK